MAIYALVDIVTTVPGQIHKISVYRQRHKIILYDESPINMPAYAIEVILDRSGAGAHRYHIS